MTGNELPETNQIIASALRLPLNKRMNVVNAMLASVEDDSEILPQAENDAAWNDEIAKRIEELKNGEVETIPSAELWKRIGGKPNG